MSEPLFDPFAGTLAEAMADADPLAIERWGAAQQLLAAREHFEAEPLAGVHLCARYSLVMPEWLAAAFDRAYSKVMRAEVGSWDEAFGDPLKGVQLSRLRFRRRTRMAIFKEVIDAVRRDPTHPLNELIEAIGRKHGAGKTLAEELYREAGDELGYDVSKMKKQLAASAKSQPAKSRKLAGRQHKR